MLDPKGNFQLPFPPEQLPPPPFLHSCYQMNYNKPIIINDNICYIEGDSDNSGDYDPCKTRWVWAPHFLKVEQLGRLLQMENVAFMHAWKV